MDLDGDGITDTLIDDVFSPPEGTGEIGGSHTAMARSGRDGHLVWKTVLDPWENWLNGDAGENYELLAFPPPAGDFDGDGTPDVIAAKDDTEDDSMGLRQVASLPLQLLSGRTGAKLWSCGPLPHGVRAEAGWSIMWVEACAVERNGTPDLIVCHRSSYVTPGPAIPAGAVAPASIRLARVSGRDGRILWDITPSGTSPHAYFTDVAPDRATDLNGDGAQDMVLVPPGALSVFSSENAVIAISLRDGKRLWSRSLPGAAKPPAEVVAGDLDGAGRQSIVFMDEIERYDHEEMGVHVYDSASGQPVWSSKPGAMIAKRLTVERVVVANLEGNGRQFVCASFVEPRGMQRILVLDPGGRERVHRDFRTHNDLGDLQSADVNGDGRDELLVWYDGRLHALGGDLKEVWSWAGQSGTIGAIIPGSTGRASEVMISSGIGLDGRTGRPRWTGAAGQHAGPDQFRPELLDRGDSRRLPLLIGTGSGATVCRVAMRTEEDGSIAAARGAMVRPGLAAGDPRWMRPLPWVGVLRGVFGPWGMLAASGLAIVSVFLPILVVRLARGRRRLYTIRALMSLPVAAALPLLVYLSLVPRLPLFTSPILATEARVFIIGTMAGLPIVWCAVWMGGCLVRLRFRPIFVVVGLFILCALAVAAAWLWRERGSMAAVESYGREGWYLVAVPGAYAAAVLWVVGRVLLGGFRLLRRP